MMLDQPAPGRRRFGLPPAATEPKSELRLMFRAFRRATHLPPVTVCTTTNATQPSVTQSKAHWNSVTAVARFAVHFGEESQFE
jgi:hypothetical protein